MSQNDFPYPLPEHALREFCHPGEWHLMHRPRRWNGEMVSGNGYLAIRCHRGGWLDSEHEAASAEFLSRFGKLPWGRWETLTDEWRTLATERARMDARGTIGIWLNGRLAPCPVVRVNEIPVRLHLLQLVARLPRVEVWCGTQSAGEPLWFRFSGGRGCIAPDARLDGVRAEMTLLAPVRDGWTGERTKQERTRFQGLEASGSMKHWPPADMTDAD